jgi:hypothetical protein
VLNLNSDVFLICRRVHQKGEMLEVVVMLMETKSREREPDALLIVERF